MRQWSINPSFAAGWHWSGVLRIFAGQPGLAIQHFQTFLRLSPRDRPAHYLNSIAEAYFFSRQFDEAAANLLESLERAWSSPVTYRVLASCYAHMGRLDRSARDRQAAACDYPWRHGARDAVSQPGTPRAFSVGSAPGRH